MTPTAGDLLREAGRLLDEHGITGASVHVNPYQVGSHSHILDIRPYRDRHPEPEKVRAALHALARDIGAQLTAEHSSGGDWSVHGSGQLLGARCIISQRLSGGRASVIGLPRPAYNGGTVIA